jgi:glycosyltransferase involved in cell wall biosynthesis
MRAIYRRARIVLAPSRWEEAFGRIAAEAHVSGIPVIAAARGGLPEAVGEGGLLIDADAPIAVWVDTVRRVWSDGATYADLSANALVHAGRPALDRDAQIATLIAELQRAIDVHTPARERVQA